MAVAVALAQSICKVKAHTHTYEQYFVFFSHSLLSSLHRVGEPHGFRRLTLPLRSEEECRCMATDWSSHHVGRSNLRQGAIPPKARPGCAEDQLDP